MSANAKVEVVEVKLEPHPDPEVVNLAVVRVGGYSVCVRTQDWAPGVLGAFIPPDSVVPATEQFKFLGDNRRIRVKRLRGQLSQGLLVPAPAGTEVGDDVAEILGVTRYDPPGTGLGGQNETGPPGLLTQVYDVEPYLKYGKDLLVEGEEIVVTEKIHGANYRVTWWADRLWVGSRHHWKRLEENQTQGFSGNQWWKALEEYSNRIPRFLRRYPGITLYGEMYGSVQSLKYGHSSGAVSLAFFDILSIEGFWTEKDRIDQFSVFNIPAVPILYQGPYSDELVRSLANGPSMIPGANHMREGIVIRPYTFREDYRIGKVVLKLISDDFLEQDK